MSLDISRLTFDPRRNFLGVVMQQGRVQLDSDWNEFVAELLRRIQAGTLDTLGQAVYPAATANAFKISAAQPGGTDSRSVSIGVGRMYVDGLLVENHGPIPADNQPPLPSDPSLGAGTATPTDYAHQPYPPQLLTLADGSYLAYLDVWQRPVSYLECPELVEKAVNVDTTGRLQTVWQVKLLPLQGDVTCTTSALNSIPRSTGLLSMSLATQAVASTNPCCLTANTGYTGLENQLYRVEIHKPGEPGTATYKWSRDNASVGTSVLNITTVNGTSNLALQSIGRDQVLNFGTGDCVEVINDFLEFQGLPGEIHKILNTSGSTITLDSAVSSTITNNLVPAQHTRIRRWESGELQVPATGVPQPLENGITATFGSVGYYNTGDFWTTAARTFDGTIEEFTNHRARGIIHHYAKLAVVTFPIPLDAHQQPIPPSDCRIAWPPFAPNILYYVGGDGQLAGKDNRLPKPLQVSVFRGQTPVAGATVQFAIQDPATDHAPGSLQGLSGGASGPTLPVQTDSSGLAQCNWTLDATLLGQWQTVEAKLLDSAGNPLPQPVHFNAVNPRDDGITITDVSCGENRNNKLHNDQTISLNDIATGIVFALDRPLSLPDSALVSPATCYLTVEVPVANFVANVRSATPIFVPVVIEGRAVFTTGRAGNQITWKPIVTIDTLSPLLQGSTCLARFTIQGNFIWGTTASTYLDGDTFGVAAPAGAKAPDSQNAIALQLPSGDGRKGGDFRMWFWLTPPADSTPALVHSTLAVDKQALAFPTVATGAPGVEQTVTVTLPAPPPVGQAPAAQPAADGQQPGTAAQPEAPPANQPPTFNLAIVNDDHGNFKLTSPSSITLTPGQSVPVVVKFAPTIIGQLTATLQIDGSTAGDSVQVVLTGTGAAPV